jgi:UDP-N-acetyl-D-galactosamine dehydrogenase
MVPHGRKIAVIGLGYIGLPVAVAFARSGTPVIAYDSDRARVRELAAGKDRTHQVGLGGLEQTGLLFTARPSDLAAADFYIITVPASLGADRRADLSELLEASEQVGRRLRRGDIVVYESTVYPGATEAECIPALERASGLVASSDFAVGYSPERINPGDPEHQFAAIKKVIASGDSRALDVMAEVYGSVVTAGLYRAASIRVAEVAKAFENTQRDVNIALMNELSDICHAVKVDTMDVLATAASKWNFLPFTPGLVGGRCLTSDSYFLMDGAQRAGFQADFIARARQLNDGGGAKLAQETLRLLQANGEPKRVIVLGLTFKENVPDMRNSQALEMIRALQASGSMVQVNDPVADAEAAHRCGIHIVPMGDLVAADAVILAVPHATYLAQGWPMIMRLLKDGRGLVMDVKSRLDRALKPHKIELWRL